MLLYCMFQTQPTVDISRPFCRPSSKPSYLSRTLNGMLVLVLKQKGNQNHVKLPFSLQENEDMIKQQHNLW